ncbi:MAG: biotin--[acetyl-CoA-carboxylase] ligase [Gammaproteobacteria bacterium]|nr:biotin--[acetyl-CoA-carboxylase] ligase [Gammaproteobacteria bacterium]
MSSFDPINESVLRRKLDEAQVACESLQVFSELDSTNAYLMRQTEAEGFQVCVAEAQTHGRGRRGKPWLAPMGSGLTFSCVQRLSSTQGRLAGFSLAVGITLAEKLTYLGLPRVALKWPNDLCVDGKKLAGLLIEVQPSVVGKSAVVTGIGLNYALSSEQSKEIDQPCVGVTQLGLGLSRSELLAELLIALAQAYEDYEERGFSSFYSRWSRWDLLQGREVNLILPKRILQGVAKGVDQSGCLRILVAGQLRTFSSGEVSVRVAQ